MGIAKDGGQILPRGEQVLQHLDILRICALVVGQKHSAAQIGAVGKGHYRLHIGLLGGERVGAVGGRLVEGDVVGN